MKISDILSEDMVLAGLTATSKSHAIEQIAEFVAAKKHCDAHKIYEAIWERENLGSTGYGESVAFPHARIDDLKELITVFVQLKNPIDYDALDGNPVDLLAVIISPEKSGEDHLQILALFSRLLKNHDICDKVRHSQNAQEIYKNLLK